MIVKTILEKDGQEVVISEGHTIVNGSIKNFCIEESEQYFVNEKRAIRAGYDLLLKKTLPKFRYKEKQQEKRKQIGANKVINMYRCYKETAAYTKRWDGVLYLKTKKGLCNELKVKLNEVCKKYGFENAHAAIGFKERINK